MAGPIRSTGRRSILQLISVIALVAVSCGSPNPSLPTTRETPEPATSERPVPGSELRIAVPLIPPFGRFGFDTVVNRMIHSALLRYDATFRPVPDLAQCDVPDAAVTVRCELTDARFHDGSAVTANDVVFSYRLASAECRSWTTPPGEFTPWLCRTPPVSIEARGARTVVFTLAEPDATFITLTLPVIPIESEAVIRRSYERFMSQAKGADVEKLAEAASRYDRILDNRDAVCEPQLNGAERLLRDIGYQPWDRSEFASARPGAQPDPCWNLRFLSGRLKEAFAALDPDLDAMSSISQAYELLDMTRLNPVGAGPWRFDTYDPQNGRLVLTAASDYHGQAPAIERVVVLRVADEERASDMLRAGAVDWWNAPSAFRIDDWALSEPGLQLARYPELSYILIGYNLRPGMPFADKRLRQAMEYCVDKKSSVDAATRGRGTVINSPVPPASWAYQPLAGVDDAVDFGRKLIEGGGWTPGSDGIYVKDGRRLLLTVLVRNDSPDAETARSVETRLKFLDIAAWKLKRCGIELKTEQVSFDDEMSAMNGQGLPGHEPIDAALFGWVFAPDPDDTLWDSTKTPEFLAKNDRSWHWPDEAADWMGFVNPKVDRLLEAGRKTYDIEDRGRIYRDVQQILGNERPAMFLYAINSTEILTKGLRYRDEPLSLSTQRWWWKLEDLEVDRQAAAERSP